MAAMCKTICENCGQQFPYPSLGDFAYGQFILTRVDGHAYRHLCGIGEPIWDYVEARGVSSNVVEIVARLADHSDGHGFTESFVCPHCQSSRFKSWGGEIQSLIDLPAPTFQTFCALDEPAKDALVRKIKMELKTDN